MTEAQKKKPRIDLPGRLFETRHKQEWIEDYYYCTDQVMSLELFGSPDPSTGLYTLDNVRWWHEAYVPFRDAPVEAGDACFCELRTFAYGTPMRGISGVSLPVRTLVGLDDLHGKRIYNSIQCLMCGFHIYIDIYFLQKES